MGCYNMAGKTPHARSTGLNVKLVVQLIFLAFPLFLSVDLDNISSILDNIVNIWKLLSFLLLTVAFIRLSINNKLSAQLIVFVSLLMILLVSTLLMEGSLIQYFIIWGGFFGVVLLAETYIKTRPRELLIALKITLSTLVLINALTVLVFPNGIWTVVQDEGWRLSYEGYWLFGHRNNFGTPILAALLACSVSDIIYYARIKKSTVVIAVASIYSVVVTWSATSLVTTVLALALLVGIIIFGSFKAIRPGYLLGAYALVDIGIVFFDIQNRFAALIKDVLHRSADLTGRSQLWDIVKTKIRESPIFGYGIRTTVDNGLTVYNSNYVHAHNGELDIVYNSGFLGLACYIVLLILAVMKCGKNWDCAAVQLAFFFLILMMVHAITGLFFSSYTCLALWLCLNAETLKKLSSGVR